MEVKNRIDGTVYVTVRDLIRQLQSIDKDRVVILASDVLGREHTPMLCMWTGAYDEDTGKVGNDYLTEKQKQNGADERYIVNGIPAIILIPNEPLTKTSA